MGLLKSFFSQCARPEGSLGRAMLCFMNYTHAPLTNWGLKLVDVQDGWTMLDVGCGGGSGPICLTVCKRCAVYLNLVESLLLWLR